MGLASLDAALSGLRISQQQINLISANVSNVGTEGYTRKILPQSAQTVNGLTVGVRAETIIRNVDIRLERDLWTQESATNFYDIRGAYLKQVEAFHGPPDAELSIAAEIGRLRDSFSLLSDSPESAFLQASVVDEAVDTAHKINEFSKLITTLRNDVQEEMAGSVDRINNLLDQIANLNVRIRDALNVGRSVAVAEDERSLAMRDLSELIDLSFFQRGDGVIVVQTNEGAELASDIVKPLSYASSPVSAGSFYPDSASPVYLGDPVTDQVVFDLTTRNLGGKLGGLITLRDEIFPKQMAQLDELAHKMALRFEAQGLRLFTDQDGNIPRDIAPTPNPPGPLQAVEYVGFSDNIRVNEAILNNNQLVQQGTYGAILETGSNDVIQRVLDFTFGDVDYQQAIGSVDLRASGNAAPNDTLQNFLGLPSTNIIDGGVDLTGSNGYNSLADLLAAGGDAAFGTPPNETDSFTITLSDPDFGGTYVIELDLSVIAAAPTAGSAGQDLVNAITGDADWANAVTDFGATVSVGANGQLVIESRGDIAIAAAGTDPLSTVGFEFLGLPQGSFSAQDPHFDVIVGNNAPVRITIEPTDDETSLLAKLQAVEGLAVEDITASADGFLRIRPGDDYTNPNFGGELTLVSGAFKTSGAGANTVFGVGTIPDNLNVVSALFGSFSGTPALDSVAVRDVAYASETNATITPPIPTKNFRTDFLGPGANISTDVIGAFSLIDHAQKLVNQNTQEQILNENRGQDETTLRDILSQQLENETGVNLDEELGFLIVVQTAYAASARVINAVDELFNELLNVLR